MPRPYSFVVKHTAEDEYIGIYGIFERKKQPDDIPKIWEYEICLSKSRILEQGVLCRYDRQKHGSDKAIYRKPAKKGQRSRPVKHI